MLIGGGAGRFPQPGAGGERAPAGGTGAALIELRAERRGRHAGTLTVAAGADTLRIPLRMVVYP